MENHRSSRSGLHACPTVCVGFIHGACSRCCRGAPPLPSNEHRLVDARVEQVVVNELKSIPECRDRVAEPVAERRAARGGSGGAGLGPRSMRSRHCAGPRREPGAYPPLLRDVGAAHPEHGVGFLERGANGLDSVESTSQVQEEVPCDELAGLRPSPSAARRAHVLVYAEPRPGLERAAEWSARRAAKVLRRGHRARAGARLLFGLRWRQTEGFLASVLELMGLELDVPDHTTLSRRTRDLHITLAPRPSDQLLQLVFDSAGLAVFGQGEWATAKWGGRGRRGWKKLHIAVDQEGQIRAAVLTEPTCTDPAVAPALLERIEGAVCEVIADGAYDQRPVYQAIHDKGARSVIPPSKAAKILGEPVHRERDAHLERIEKVGRRQWRRESRHHQQSRAENSS